MRPKHISRMKREKLKFVRDIHRTTDLTTDFVKGTIISILKNTSMITGDNV